MALVLPPLHRLGRRLWRWLLRLERPRQAIAPWLPLGATSVVAASLLVALVSSWPWLVQPSLMPGVPSPFSVRAPREARVIDSAALEQRRSLIGARSDVQV
ncbi:MAG: HD family phosphohydrolase, partial [Cyanobium sp.]